ncbi:Uncharacterized protein BP5553_02147 [Venustampulla echinocandica]|uniref:CSN8/PSMD8/EIF3K domain-containing protein n=1 Tax=Venustampulla echinocandica TaxID=2656787 RepID=A0A370U316_9HELO|nr:Uncharacterized protein BP5553_02147 [Venustampulla echinocandica]RDL42168.1 Uncharacterized protein BP5553_02147 [Venustampulla echinocandica]
MSTHSPRGRATSGAWSRLKPANLDPLEAIGLPSKGDKRLLDHKAQERYYTKIIDRYMSFCSDAGRSDELLRRLARMDISRDDSRNETPQTAVPNTADLSIKTIPSEIGPAGQKDLSMLMMAMRKLREGIVASKRVDDFSIQAYIFCIRLSILLKEMESYHPAILHLLKRMHAVQPLTKTELHEFVGYLVLDLACRQNDLAGAYAVKHKWGLKDSKVDVVLHALTHDNYFLFWQAKRNVDGHKAKLMEFAEDGMRRQTLKCLGRSYLSIDLPSLEAIANSPWPSLTKDCGVGWQLDGATVIIRKPKTR